MRRAALAVSSLALVGALAASLSGVASASTLHARDGAGTAGTVHLVGARPGGWVLFTSRPATNTLQWQGRLVRVDALGSVTTTHLSVGRWGVGGTTTSQAMSPRAWNCTAPDFTVAAGKISAVTLHCRS
jgi:hypothetical protein